MSWLQSQLDLALNPVWGNTTENVTKGVVSMKKCDCDERIGININSLKQFEELKDFFEEQVEKGLFVEMPVKKPYYIGYSVDGKATKWYADKWYKCLECGILWEFVYPEFPAQGSVRKLNIDDYMERNFQSKVFIPCKCRIWKYITKGKSKIRFRRKQ